MKVIIHDLSQEDWNALSVPMDHNTKVIDNQGAIRKCVGCFGCWIQTPGQCIIRDEYQKIGALFGKTEELIIISKCCFGSYSSFVKNVLDRSISYILPFFEIREGEMHHKARYQNHIQQSAFFYGEEISEKEKETARKLVEANAQNFNGTVKQVCFVDRCGKIRDVIV